MTVSLATARSIAEFAYADAEAKGLTSIGIVVTDPGGHIRFAMRSDAQGIFGIDTAIGKARTALGFNRSSLMLSRTFVDPCGVAALAGATDGAFLPLGGGVVIQDAGVTVGAVGLSGGMPDVDDAVVRAAVEAAGLTCLA